jgi:hypothetical protein
VLVLLLMVLALAVRARAWCCARSAAAPAAAAAAWRPCLAVLRHAATCSRPLRSWRSECRSCSRCANMTVVSLPGAALRQACRLCVCVCVLTHPAHACCHTPCRTTPASRASCLLRWLWSHRAAGLPCRRRSARWAPRSPQASVAAAAAAPAAAALPASKQQRATSLVVALGRLCLWMLPSCRRWRRCCSRA